MRRTSPTRRNRVLPPIVADRAQLRLELTRTVIEARLDRARLGRFEVPESGSVESYCRGERWLYERSANGDLTIRYSGSEADRDNPRLERFPLAFRIPVDG